MEIKGHEIKGRMPIFQRWGRDAVRAGTKTQTRRIIKLKSDLPFQFLGSNSDGVVAYFGNTKESCRLSDAVKCPYGKPGDIRGMREPLKKSILRNIQYADDETYIREVPTNNARHGVQWRWKRDTLSSLFMPTKYGRTLCEIIDTRAERLQDISEEDCIEEGSQTPCAQLPKSCQQGCMTERTQFSRIWDSINAKRAWESNPWIWKISFKRL